jgi:hypothetical protein
VDGEEYGLMTRHRFVLALLVAALVVAASPRFAAATPAQFDFAAGRVTVKGYYGGTQVISPVVLKLTGTQITLDTATSQLVSVDFTASGPLDMAMKSSMGGLDGVVVDSLSVSASNGWLVQHSANLYSFIAPSTITLDVRQQGSGASGAPQTVTKNSYINGALVVDPTTGHMVMQGVQLGRWGSVGSTGLFLKGDFVFRGAATAGGGGGSVSGGGGGGPGPSVPEPTAVLAFVFGLATVGGAIQRSRGRVIGA